MKATYNPNDELELPAGYRWVQPGTKLEASDLFAYGGQWIPTESAGWTCISRFDYIRKEN